MVEKKNQTNTSTEIQNEMLKDMSLSIFRDVVLEAIKSSDYHSIMVDESSDVSNKEKAVFCVHWVDEDLISDENFIGLYEMKNNNTTSMVAVIKDIILRLGLDGEKLQGLCYDGCSTMMVKKKRVATQIEKDVQPLALSTLLCAFP